MTVTTGIQGPERAQVQDAVRVLKDTFGDGLVAVYLFGSAALGRLRPSSDLDLMVVSGRPTTPDEKRSLASALRKLSGEPRHLEVTIVVHHEIKPWRYPPRMDFQYGD